MPISWSSFEVVTEMFTAQILNWPRGKVLGGTSSINYMLFARGCKQDYNSWEQVGANGWSYDEFLPYLRKTENYLIEDLAESPYHGKEGPVHVSGTVRTPLSEIFIQAGQELGMIVRFRLRCVPCIISSSFQRKFCLMHVDVISLSRRSVFQLFVFFCYVVVRLVSDSPFFVYLPL